MQSSASRAVPTPFKKARAPIWLFLAALAALWLAPSAAAAQPTPIAAELSAAQQALRQVGSALRDRSLSDSALQKLRANLDQPDHEAHNAVERLTPQIAGVRARLDQLGPAPAKGAPPEDPAITAQRNQQIALQDALTAKLKQARLVEVDIAQIESAIAARRRSLFVDSVFARSFSIFSPSLWSKAVAEAPRDARALAGAWASWRAVLAERLDGWSRTFFAAALLAVGLIYLACALLARKILSRASAQANPTRLARALAAVWTAIMTALAPILSIAALVAALHGFQLVNPSTGPILKAIIDAVIRIGLTAGIARGLLAPTRPNWRLLDLSTPTSERLFGLAILLSVLVSLGKILGALDDVITISLPISIVIRAASALLVAFAMAAALRGILPDEDADEACLGPKVTPRADWYAPLRLGAWSLILAVVGAVSLGYIALAAFLVDQLVWISFIGSLLYILSVLANEGLLAALKPSAAVGRGFVRTLGFRRESLQQIAIAASGATTLALFVVAALLALAPWGIELADMLGSLRAAFFGFHVGGLSISLSGIALAVLLFACLLLIAKWMQRWLDTRFLPATRLDVGLQNAIRTSVGYLGFAVAASVGLSELGLNFQKLAIVAGALSVGIGFGLQSIVNNFVSGLIILWERAIRVGDLVVVGDDQGHVKRINVRATEIETFDRVTMIVPNSNLVGGVVKNWMRNDRMSRIRIQLSLGLNADPETVRDLLVGCARRHEMVVKLPAPQALFTAIDTTLKFELICFVDDVETAARVKSDLYFDLFRKLREAGLELPSTSPPPVTVHLTGVERSAPAPTSAATGPVKAGGA